MPRIFDNIDKQLLPTLRETLEVSNRAEFCVGYFNLRGWKQIDSFIERWPGGDGSCCRLLVGMNRSPDDQLRDALSLVHRDVGIDNQAAIRLRKALAEEFRAQLTVGIPTDQDENGLRRLARQIKSKKVCVKLFLRHLCTPSSIFSSASPRRSRTLLRPRRQLNSSAINEGGY
jgi:hypothetical protein